MKYKIVVVMLCTVFLMGVAGAQIAPDPQIMQAINHTRALDNHTHVPKVTGPGEKDDEYDALPCSGYLEPSDDPGVARPATPTIAQARKALYGHRYNDRSPEHVAELRPNTAHVQQPQVENLPA